MPSLAEAAHPLVICKAEVEGLFVGLIAARQNMQRISLPFFKARHLPYFCRMRFCRAELHDINELNFFSFDQSKSDYLHPGTDQGKTCSECRPNSNRLIKPVEQRRRTLFLRNSSGFVTRCPGSPQVTSSALAEETGCPRVRSLTIRDYLR